MKQINAQRERTAAKEAEVTEKGEKWKHQKQDRGKKQNPRDAWKKKVQYVTACKKKACNFVIGLCCVCF